MVKGTHGTHTISQTHQYHAQIARHGHEHFTKIFNLLLITFTVRDLAHAMTNRHQLEEIGPKFGFQLGHGRC